jgi:hypothetical protein
MSHIRIVRQHSTVIFLNPIQSNPWTGRHATDRLNSGLDDWPKAFPGPLKMQLLHTQKEPSWISETAATQSS